jgi:DNA repair protein RecN (Recombination protein N)
VLVGLSIRDIVVVERLDIELGPGLSVVTGETGAGKSILLDALGLALGVRGVAGMVRRGADKGSVSAAFTLDAGHPAIAMAREHDLAEDTALVLRRVIGVDARGRAFVNDRPVSVGLLRELAHTLVEVHGQNDQRALVNEAGHRAMLDAFGANQARVAAARNAWRAMESARAVFAEAETALQTARADEQAVRREYDDLTALDPAVGEERDLASRRAFLMQGQGLAQALNEAIAALANDLGASARLGEAQRALRDVAPRSGGRLDESTAALDRAAVETADAMSGLEALARELDLDPAMLERTEERLFALRAAARHHRTDVDSLLAIRALLAERLAALEAGGGSLERLRGELDKAREAYRKSARVLGAARRTAAKRLDGAIAEELAPLKLGQAVFQTAVTTTAEAAWGREGTEHVAFQISTVPGTEPGPLARIASGGELSRLMLALKVVLARTMPVTTLIFDEVDRDIGGATAHAVGERLETLAEGAQVVVITHAPQVAARGRHHWRVTKALDAEGARVSVVALDDADRHEEVARMLAGDRVTEAARAAAASLIEGRRP